MVVPTIIQYLFKNPQNERSTKKEEMHSPIVIKKKKEVVKDGMSKFKLFAIARTSNLRS